MAKNDWIYQLRSVQLVIILCVSLVFFFVQLFLSHISHSLTLLVHAYHMLCNIIALTGCIMTLKHTQGSFFKCHEQRPHVLTRNGSEDHEFLQVVDFEGEQDVARSTQRMQNTFGWTRIDVLSMLVVCIFLASLCFSIFVEAIQTLIHLDHAGDTMHYPIYVLLVGGSGMILNIFCYLSIGGFTFHQGSFLSVNDKGDVMLQTVISGEQSIRQGRKRLSRDKPLPKGSQPVQKKRESSREVCRDMCSSIFVILCAILVYGARDDEGKAKYIDPVIAIVSCMILLYYSYPFMKESCLILLQTIPASIDIDEFKRELTGSIKDIVNVHDLHIWQLTANKYVCTAHIIFESPEIFTTVKAEIDNFFEQQGINIVTIQPEFMSAIDSETVQKPGQTCLVQCRDQMCRVKHCCKTSSQALESKQSLCPSLCPSREVSSTRLPELAEVTSVKTEIETPVKASKVSEVEQEKAEDQRETCDEKRLPQCGCSCEDLKVAPVDSCDEEKSNENETPETNEEEKPLKEPPQA